MGFAESGNLPNEAPTRWKSLEPDLHNVAIKAGAPPIGPRIGRSRPINPNPVSLMRVITLSRTDHRTDRTRPGWRLSTAAQEMPEIYPGE
jgi:hypothetical protein